MEGDEWSYFIIFYTLDTLHFNFFGLLPHENKTAV